MAGDAILFDIDGTLVDSTYHHALAWQRAFARHGEQVPFRDIHRAIGMGGDRLVAHVVGEDFEQRAGDDARDAWAEEYDVLEPEVHPLPGAAEAVRAVHEAGYRVALASSGQQTFAERALEDLGVGDVVDLVTTNDDVEESKPDPDLLEVTLGRLGAERAVLVGDTPYDVTSAARLGLACVALRTGGYGDDELDGAAVVLDTPRDLLDLDWEQHLRAPRPRQE